MAAYHGEWRIISEEAVSPEDIALARKLAGGLIETGIASGQHKTPDGRTISAVIVNGVPKITVSPAPPPPPPEEEPDYNLWAPRGFVVYPAFNAAPFGYGLPIVNDAEHGPYTPSNLAPGLDISRWTAGGPCGEVLISRDKNAGYAANPNWINTPLLYHPTRGPGFRWSGDGVFDTREYTGAWKSYRMELAAPVANYAEENVANCEDLFEALNTYREANSQKALNLLPRGYYHPAKIMSSIMMTAGSTDATNAAYPPTYKTTTDRLTKDGYSATVMDVTFDTFNRGDHPTSFELRHFGGAADDVLTAWQGSDNATLLKDVGPAAFGDIGFRSSYWTANVTERTRWIEAGNMSWQSSDESLPPLSWHGFAGLNLAWETYPAVFDAEHHDTTPLTPVRSFTDGQGDCWLNYPRSTDPTPADLEPAMSRHIYCRGRSIAMAPRGGLVWGACVVANGDNDRLIALIHHPDDQPADYTHEGFTRYLRVWWCDIPKRAHLRLAPQQTICGVAEDDAWAWKGGEQLDLGVMSAPSVGPVASAGVNSLKYASQWRFAGDGTRAICLRDYGAYADYSALYGEGLVVTATGLRPRAVQLIFVVSTDSMSTAVSFFDYTAGATATDRTIAAPLDTTDVIDKQLYERGAVPLAVEFNASFNPLYAFVADIYSHDTVAYIIGSIAYLRQYDYAYVGYGTAGTKYASDLERRVLHGAAMKSPSVDFVQSGAIVLDISTATWILAGTKPRFEVGNTEPLDTPCSPFSSEPSFGLRLYRGGARQREDWYAQPDGAVFSINDMCFNVADAGASYVDLPQAISGAVQGHYAERANEVIYGYQHSPMPLATSVMDSEPSDVTCGCRMELGQAVGSAHWRTAAELSPRGGATITTVPAPDHDWFIYSKVV